MTALTLCARELRAAVHREVLRLAERYDPHAFNSVMPSLAGLTRPCDRMVTVRHYLFMEKRQGFPHRLPVTVLHMRAAAVAERRRMQQQMRRAA